MSDPTRWIRSDITNTISVGPTYDTCADTYGSSIGCCDTVSCIRLQPNDYMYRDFTINSRTNYCLSFYVVTHDIFDCNEYMDISYKCGGFPNSPTDFTLLARLFDSQVDACYFEYIIPCSNWNRISIKFSSNPSFKSVFDTIYCVKYIIYIVLYYHLR